MKLLETVLQKLDAENRDDQKKLLAQFTKFGLVGLSNTLVSWICYYVFLWINDDLYMLGSLVGTEATVQNIY